MIMEKSQKIYYPPTQDNYYSRLHLLKHNSNKRYSIVRFCTSYIINAVIVVEQLSSMISGCACQTWYDHSTQLYKYFKCSEGNYSSKI